MVQVCASAFSNQLQTRDKAIHSALTLFAVFFVTERSASELHAHVTETLCSQNPVE
jgi:hypothetical protein